MRFKKFHMDNVIHLRIPAVMLDKLNEESFATGVSKQDLIRASIKTMLEKKYDKDLFMQSEEIKPKFSNEKNLLSSKIL